MVSASQSQPPGSVDRGSPATALARAALEIDARWVVAAPLEHVGDADHGAVETVVAFELEFLFDEEFGQTLTDGAESDE